MADSGLRTHEFSLAELEAAWALLPPLTFVQPPSAVQSLTSYVETYGGGKNVSTIMTLLGYDPTLAERVDQGVQKMPIEAINRIADFLQRPPAEVVWACNGQLRAPAPGIGRVFP